MTKNDVIEKLRAGYELANRGTGWWLSAPKNNLDRKMLCIWLMSLSIVWKRRAC